MPTEKARQWAADNKSAWVPEVAPDEARVRQYELKYVLWGFWEAWKDGRLLGTYTTWGEAEDAVRAHAEAENNQPERN